LVWVLEEVAQAISIVRHPGENRCPEAIEFTGYQRPFRISEPGFDGMTEEAI
jgi:hypothetical protein